MDVFAFLLSLLVYVKVIFLSFRKFAPFFVKPDIVLIRRLENFNRRHQPDVWEFKTVYLRHTDDTVYVEEAQLPQDVL